MLTQKRGKNLTVAGAVLQTAFAVVMLVIALRTHSRAAMAVTVFLAGGVGLWLMCAVLFYCRQLARREEHELAELAAGRETSTIFDRQTERELRPAAARVAFMERWVVPVFTLLWAGYHVTVGAAVLRWLIASPPLELAFVLPGMLFAVLAAFLSLLFSMYCLGMSRDEQWRLLRAGGSYLLVGTLSMAAVAVALLLANMDKRAGDRVFAFILPIAQLILAAELVLNFLLELYRPRIPGQEARPSFDSRLLNLIAQPGRVGHSLAEALNYQFGFEVSRTWFYRLLSRSMAPLLIFGAATLVGLSAIVVVDAGEQAVVLHWGVLDSQRGTLRAGIHFKWPWPIETARKFRVEQVQELLLGVGEERMPVRDARGRELQLWTEEHGQFAENDFLIGIPPRRVSSQGVQDEQAPPVNILKLVVMVHYVIDDVKKFGFDYVDAPKLLECVAYREMVRYCATATLDKIPESQKPPGEAADRPEAILTTGRELAARVLRERIEKAVGPEGLDLGVRITYLGIPAAHPPAQAAGAFEEVFQAERQKEGLIFQAEADANEILAQVGGTPATALRLALDVRRLEEYRKLRDVKDDPVRLRENRKDFIARSSQDIKSLDEEIEGERLRGQVREGRQTVRQQLRDSYQAHLDVLNRIAEKDLDEEIAAAQKAADAEFDRSQGEPTVRVVQAEAQRWQKELGERGRAEAFLQRLAAYRANPQFYRMDRYLTVLQEALPDASKYVLTIPRDQVEIRLDLEAKSSAAETLLPPPKTENEKK